MRGVGINATSRRPSSAMLRRSNAFFLEFHKKKSGEGSGGWKKAEKVISDLQNCLRPFPAPKIRCAALIPMPRRVDRRTRCFDGRTLCERFTFWPASRCWPKRESLSIALQLRRMDSSPSSITKCSAVESECSQNNIFETSVKNF